MADETRALSMIPPALPADADYDAIYTAFMATARGRWFLEEYARRNRNADTALLLGAIARIDDVIRRGQDLAASQPAATAAVRDGEPSAPAPEASTDPLADVAAAMTALMRSRDAARAPEPPCPSAPPPPADAAVAALAQADPLAALTAMSEAQRIALFT